MQLSKRMQKLASLVTEGNRLADVGTDHAYIPIALTREKKIPSALAMDVNEGPLGRAGKHIQEAGLSTYIAIRRSDGLRELKAGEADTVLIAGMGGMLTVRILEEGAHCLDTVGELILQPQSDIRMVRRWLCGHGFLVTVEEIAEEDGKYYPMIKAVHGQERKLSEEELCYGKPEVQRSAGVLGCWLMERLARDRRIMETLQENQREDSDRAEEIRERIRRTEHVFERVNNCPDTENHGRT